MPRTPSFFGLLLLAFMSAGWAPVCLADISEEQAKAILIHNFSKFVQWPNQPEGGTINICIYGDDPIQPELARLQGKPSKGRIIEIRQADTPAGAERCEILYIGKGQQTALRKISQHVRLKPVLIISDIPGSATAGAIVEVFFDMRRTAFKVNRGVAIDAGLGISSKVLTLAAAVYSSN